MGLAVTTDPRATLDATNYGGYEIMKSVNATFEPKEDITAYELARLLPYLHGRPLTEVEWESLGHVARHLKRS